MKFRDKKVGDILKKHLDKRGGVCAEAYEKIHELLDELEFCEAVFTLEMIKHDIMEVFFADVSNDDDMALKID